MAQQPGAHPARPLGERLGDEPGAPLARARVAAWVVYDLANTIYIATVTYAFTPYAKVVLGGDLTWHGLTNLLSMIAAALLVPFFGSLCDTTGRAGRYLTVATLACIAALSGWYFDLGSLWLLALFFVANLAYNVALLFYNALLTSVAPPERAGSVGGLGVGIGYMGTLLVLAVLGIFAPSPRTFFLLAAGGFLALSLPCMLLVRDRRAPQAADRPLRALVREANGRTLQALRSLPQHRPLMWFLLGNFCLVDVLNTAILYFADFTEDVFAEAAQGEGFSLFGMRYVGEDGTRSYMYLAGLALNVLALVFGVTIGRWTDRAPLTVMRTSGVALLFAVVGGVVLGGHSPLGYLLSLVLLGAFGLTGIWTAGRKIVVQLAPPDRVGQYFGLYGITVKLSVVGALIYTLVKSGAGPRPAMLAQTTQLLLGLVCLFMVRVPKTTSTSTR